MAERLWPFRTDCYFNGQHNKLPNLSFNQYTALCGAYEGQSFITNAEQIDKVVKNSYIYVSNHRVNTFIAAPCGRCIACQDFRRREYESRALFEAADYPNLFFFTLTYSDKHLPKCGLFRPHVVQFLKLFRETLAYKYSKFFNVSIEQARIDTRFRVFYCGEYATDPRYTRRPHYHGILFFEKPVPQRWFNWFRKIFRKCWHYGRRFDLQYVKNPVASARYICKYITKQNINVAPEGKNPCFVQGPTQCGLGSSKLENHLEDILMSTDNRVYLHIGRQVCNVRIPKFLLTKIFPTFSRLYRTEKKSLFDSKLCDIFYDLELIRQELLYRQETDPFCFYNVHDFDYIFFSFDWLRVTMKRNSVDVERMLIRKFDTTAYYQQFDTKSLLDEYLTTLHRLFDFLPTPQEFIEQFSKKLEWQNKLQIPDLPYEKRLQSQTNVALNNLNYVKSRMLGNEICLSLQM